MRVFCLMMALLVPGLVLGAAVEVEDPWVAEPPPGAPVVGGFMLLHNGSDEDRSLVGARGDNFGKIELHQTVREDGMARMIPQDSIPIPAGSTTALEHGGYHLMLMQPEKTLVAGDRVALELRFDDGSKVSIEAPVRRMGHMGH